MHRKAGLAALQQEQKMKARMKELGQQVQRNKVEAMKAQMAAFKEHLEDFTFKYREDIKHDPLFRSQFHQMCANVGVDPLASNKNKWTQLLAIGDFYFELGVEVVEACMALRSDPQEAGGLVRLSTMLERVNLKRGSRADRANCEDIMIAIRKLKALGGGWALVTIGTEQFVRCVPSELSTDGNLLLEIAQKCGGVFSKAQAASRCGWTDLRISEALHVLSREGLVLIDDPGQGSGEPRLYWFPAFGMETSVENYLAKKQSS